MKKAKVETKAKKEIASGNCNDENCNFHGKLKTHGRNFEGTVIKKFPKRVVIEFERMIYVRKYERYKKSGTKLHARLSDCFEKEISVGDLVRIQECRPLSKLVHFVVIEKLNEGGIEQEKIKSKEDKK